MKPPRLRILPDGMALTGDAVAAARGDRIQADFGNDAGMGERTIRRMEAGTGATLTQALALAGAELARGDIQTAAYLLSMIGETLPLTPRWAPARQRTPSPDIRWNQ